MVQPVVIIGGGLTGIIAARTLHTHGINGLIVEKGRSVGGRMATRRVDGGKVDHGAQFFTVRTALFQQAVNQWEEAGVVQSWFGERHIRYKSNEGMNHLAKYLAQDVNVRLNTKITELRQLEKNAFSLITEENELIKAKALIVTAPVPQSVALLRGLYADDDDVKQLEKVQYNPCFVLILSFSQATEVEESGYVASNLPDGIERLVDHSRKSVSDVVTVSVYSTGQWATEHWVQGDDTIKRQLLQKVALILPTDHLKSVQLKRWKYSEAVTPVPTPYIRVGHESPLLVAGDAFLQETDNTRRTRLESAFLSGVSVGNEMARLLQTY
ncbi:hypothetical [Halalkalibacter wakoensis JCM 9140]|uniref:Amine oxidase domain-containing protein n=1 Tax=Halalkalibacter wakoensis JCM 9140 TaxID=1236970 RepID=W4Q1W0_9BACI|nr:FAD-dependent oxidoreductase [Halalkalibacter wakoensis]GAE25952.1 hypothetical [Halalkalibacter wakoensis JCM 9140]